MIENQTLWVTQLKKGNELAALNLYNSYSKAMYNILTRMMSDDEMAKDLLQESFVKAFNKIDNLGDPATFGGWLKRIVVNTGLEHLRKRKYQFEDINDEVLDQVDDSIEEGIEPEVIHQEIKKLPVGCRTVLTLFLLEGYSHEQIAEELNISASTSRTQFRYAKQLLKEKLKDAYEKTRRYN